MIETFRGKNIRDMDKDELINVIRYLANDVAFYQTPDKQEAIALGRVEQLRRGSVNCVRDGGKFKCPINSPGCTESCGGYGCGN